MKAALVPVLLLGFSGAACCVWLGLVEFFRVAAARVCSHCKERE